jgi:predicted TIM-barrel fold metal-dependent hydrolase
MTLNDVHCHFFSPGFLAGLAAQKGVKADDPVAHLTRLLDWEHPGTVAALADRWVHELDRHHVSRVALIASAPGDESSVADAAARHPTRIVGFFMFDPTAPDAEARLARALAQPGLRGVCLFPAMHRYPITGDAARRAIAAVADRPGCALFVHCGVLSVGVRRKLGLPSRFEMRFGNPLDLQGIALEHPEMPIIVPHFGAGLFREALMLADVCPNVYLDTSSSNGWLRYHPGLMLTDVYRAALQVAGPDRLVFGTDSSFFPRGWNRVVLDQQRAALEQLAVDASIAARVFGGNFDRLFPLAA